MKHVIKYLNSYGVEIATYPSEIVSIEPPYASGVDDKLWATVLREPSDEMMQAAYDTLPGGGDLGMLLGDVRSIWHAMVKASIPGPLPPPEASA
jgi:hypothetical protein